MPGKPNDNWNFDNQVFQYIRIFQLPTYEITQLPNPQGGNVLSIKPEKFS
jgi:hypothetical protein